MTDGLLLSGEKRTLSDPLWHMRETPSNIERNGEFTYCMWPPMPVASHPMDSAG